jgi:hypothetical protein
MRATTDRATARRFRVRLSHLRADVPVLSCATWAAAWLGVMALAVVCDAPAECYVAMTALAPAPLWGSGVVDG